MKTLFVGYKAYFIIALLLLIVVAALSLVDIFNGLLLVSGLATIALSIIAFIKPGLYRKLLIFLARLQIFTFAVKASYGIANSAVLALLPTVYLGGMLVGVFILGVQERLSIQFSELDSLVIAFQCLKA